MTDLIFKPSDLIADRYKVISFIAEGGMQQVYKALDKRLEREVALKTPINDSAHKRFKGSAILSAKVTHPNSAKTIDFFEHGGRQFLIEEYIDGTNLRERFAKDFECLDPFFTCYLTHRIARGVAASHHADVFHRDLKPSNIMVSSEPLPAVIKITDFGIAKMAQELIEEVIKTSGDEDRTIAIETSKTVKGAVPYMAPELLQNDNPGKPADIWAIGAICYELLTGKKPFGEGLPAITKVMTKKLPPKPTLKNAGPQFSIFYDELWNIIIKCFAYDQSKRITADQLVEALSELCYSAKERNEGIISYVSGNKGTIKSGPEDIFFHRDSFYGEGPRLGQRVIFAAFPGDPNPRAHPVLALKALP